MQHDLLQDEGEPKAYASTVLVGSINSMPLTPEELRDLRSGTFVLEALHIKLRPRVESEPAYTGPGQVRQMPDGTIEYTLYDTERIKEGLGLDRHPVVGSWVSADQFFHLNMRDWRGREWHAGPTEVGTSNSHGEKGVVCRGTLHEITCTGEGHVPGGERMSLFLPGDVKIPSNCSTRTETDAAGRRSFASRSNVWVVEGPEYTLQITRAEDGLVVEVRSEEASFPKGFDSRIEEALWFVLATPVEWHILQRHTSDVHSVTVRERPSLRVGPRLEPPLRFDTPNAAQHLGDMLLGYLRYVSGYAEPRYHPTSISLRQVFRASATFVEMEALALGVAVEGLVRREYNELGKPSKAFCGEIDAALEHWTAWDGPGDVKEWIHNGVSGYKGSSPRTAMAKLVEIGVLGEPQVEAWNKIRHTAPRMRRNSVRTSGVWSGDAI